MTVERQTEGPELREEIMVGNAVQESQAAKGGDTAESCIEGGAITIASLSPHASISS